jgi:hypothetical protein
MYTVALIVVKMTQILHFTCLYNFEKNTSIVPWIRSQIVCHVHALYVDCIWNVMVHAQKPDYDFRRNGGVHLNRLLADYWQVSSAHQPGEFVSLLQGCVLQSCDAYWLPTPFSCFPFISPPVRHRVPSHSNWTLTQITLTQRNMCPVKW